MDTWIIVLIVIAAIVVIGVFVFAGRRAQERRLEGKREEAQELRSDASEQAQRAEERQQLAEEQAERARRERAEAEERARRADELDPDIDT
jgi:uncharacterized protein HemX